MENKATVITVQTTVNVPVAKAGQYWSEPEHITKWNSASEDWYTPKAENDLRTGGKFSSRMEAKDGSMGFDFEGIYDLVKDHEYIEYHMADGRQVQIFFTEEGNQTIIVEQFDAETQNPVEMQQAGWQAIMNNFKKYVESKL
ncbi:polyketide cyclase [Mucilaginibacter limnophilus]|uniref:Polyketide cyclase n=1 Tax=Mucilaginibacter limnophilus TaxID=1932778 RepID=A0A437MRP8_9SPHI|nr:SRPBCC family protein [Mucilaginibacter limnophilus]RVU00328.1 polyketide cyclase [Mucilaginibacter limnophilus]